MKQKLLKVAMKQASEMFAKNSLFYLFLNSVNTYIVGLYIKCVVETDLQFIGQVFPTCCCSLFIKHG